MPLPTALLRDHLTIYLNDHLAGATFGRELGRRTLAANRGTEFERPLAQLNAEIEEDKETLEAIMRRVGAPRDPVKPSGAWFVEKVGRLKLNGRLSGYSALSRLVELDGLGGGFQSKLSLWRALRRIAEQDGRLGQEELDRLIERAESQLGRLAELQARAAELALAPGRGA